MSPWTMLIDSFGSKGPGGPAGFVVSLLDLFFIAAKKLSF